MRGKITSEKIADNAVDGEKHIIAGSVKTAQMALSAVTASIIADNAVTPQKVHEKVRTRPLASDDTEVSNTLAPDRLVDYEVKTVRFIVKDGANATPDKIVVAAEIKTSSVESAASFSIYMDEEVTERGTIETTQTMYDLVTIIFNVGIGAGGLSQGTHELKVKVKSGLATEICTTKLIEIYQIIL